MRVERDIINQFKAWKEAPDRKPILLKGARQIGKTWAMETFGRECFKYCVKFDFDRQPELKSVFQTSKDPQRLIKELTLYCEQPIIAGETLMIFDEIQECEEALNSLKYFRDEAPQYHIIAAGSLLGVAVKRRRMTVPVGKVRIINMYPVTFKEFLRASDLRTYEYIDSLDEIHHLPEIIMNKLRTEYRRYQVCGGMPEAIVALLENKGVGEVEMALQGILDLYELDFAKYAEPREIPRIHAVWHSLPAQLSKENRKFVWKVIKTGARSKDYEDAVQSVKERGYTIDGIIIDGKQSLFKSFAEYPIQMCQFHMKQITKRYLTKNPKLLAARALNALVDKLTRSEESVFKAELAAWKDEWHDMIDRRSIYKDGSTHYTHQRLRSAMHSLDFYMPYLFTYQRENCKGMPNTNNKIEGTFTDLKKNLNNHSGLTKENRKRFISGFFLALNNELQL